MSYYSSPSYEPISPPWSDGSSSRYDTPRAPVMPYVELPSLDEYTPPSPHYGLRTPPPSSDGGINPLLCANPTVVRYDFINPPHTIRMSSAARLSTFPSTQPASIPAESVIYIRIGSTDHVVEVHANGAGGVRCADVFNQLYAYLGRPLTSAERASVRSDVKRAFNTRRTMMGDNTARVIDLLLGRTVFKRFVLRRGEWQLQTTSP